MITNEIPGCRVRPPRTSIREQPGHAKEAETLLLSRFPLLSIELLTGIGPVTSTLPM